MEILFFSPFESDRALILWGIYLGFVAAILYLSFLRVRTGRILKTLLSAGATDEKSAVPLPAKRPDRGALAHVLKEAGDGEEKRWFIPEEKREKAEYLAGFRSFRWILPVLAILLLYAAMLGVHAVLPLLLDR